MKRILLISVLLVFACAASEAQKSQTLAAEYPNMKVPRGLQHYRALLSIDLGANARVARDAWQQGKQSKGADRKVLLTPAEGYVRYMLAGAGDVLRFGCANGFRPVNPVQTPPNTDGFIEDTPSTTGTTLQAGVVNTISYECVREAVAPHRKPAARK